MIQQQIADLNKKILDPRTGYSERKNSISCANNLDKLLKHLLKKEAR